MADTIPIQLSQSDHDLLLSALDLPAAEKRFLTAGILDGRMRRFDLSPDVVDAVLFALEDTAARAKHRKLRRSLGRLYEKLEQQVSRAIGLQMLMDGEIEIEPSAGGIQGLSDQWAEDTVERTGQLQARVADLFQSRTFPSVKVAERAVQDLVDQANQQPLDALGGLTPDAAHELFGNDWTAATPGLQLREDLPLQRLDEAAVIHNARILLTTLGSDGTRATARGNLNRAFVKKMVDALVWPEGYVDDLFHYNKVLNEGDVWLLESLRVNLELAGLVRKYRGRFVITRRGLSLLNDHRAGELFARLFRTWFRKYNLAYRDRLPEIPEFQDSVAFPLWRLSHLAKDWHRVEETVPQLLLPEVAAMIPVIDDHDFRPLLLRTRFLAPLEHFGLVRCELDPMMPKFLLSAARFRPTRLLGEFMHFTFTD